MMEETPQSAREQIEAYRGRLDETVIATALELLRSIQGLGPRRHPGGGFLWKEPEALTEGTKLGLVWKKSRRGLALWFSPGEAHEVALVYGADEGTHWGESTGLSMAADEVVQFLSDGRE